MQTEEVTKRSMFLLRQSSALMVLFDKLKTAISIFILSLLLFTGCSSLKQKNKQSIQYLKKNYSYDWLVTKITDEQLLKCAQFYKTEFEEGDELVFKQAYSVTYEKGSFNLIEFDFKDTFDSRIVFVFKSLNGEFIGYFRRSLA